MEPKDKKNPLRFRGGYVGQPKTTTNKPGDGIKIVPPQGGSGTAPPQGPSNNKPKK